MHEAEFCQRESGGEKHRRLRQNTGSQREWGERGEGERSRVWSVSFKPRLRFWNLFFSSSPSQNTSLRARAKLLKFHTPRQTYPETLARLTPPPAISTNRVAFKITSTSLSRVTPSQNICAFFKRFLLCYWESGKGSLISEFYVRTLSLANSW